MGRGPKQGSLLREVEGDSDSETENEPQSGREGGAEQRGPADMVTFCARASANLSALAENVNVYRMGADRRAMGARMGQVPLLPLESLEERIAEGFPGRHTLRVQSRTRAGQVAFYGEIALDNQPAPGPAPGAPDPNVAELG